MRVWLSFVDVDQEPPRSAGCCVVRVTHGEVDAQRARLRVEFPNASAGAPLIAAAVAKAWQLGCNPGGDVMAVELADDAPDVPIGRLMDLAELHARGLVVPE